LQEKNKINTSAGSYETSEEELSNPLPVAEVVKFPENELPGSLTDPDVNFAKRRKFIEQAELFTGGCGESFATLKPVEKLWLFPVLQRAVQRDGLFECC